jgi:sugar porter (SP) family MFS transporter
MTEVKTVETVAATYADEPLKEGLQERVVQGSDAMAKAFLANPPKPFSKNACQLYLIALIGLLVGTMTGIDESIMGSFLVMKPFQNEFGAEVSGVKAGYLTAMFQIGSVCSLPFVGEALDRFGRRFGIFVGCAFVVLGTIMQGTSQIHGSLGQFLGGRFLLGFGTNIALAAGPTYIVEISHPAYRGVLTALQSATQNFGGFIGSLCTRLTVKYTNNLCWLIPVWLQIIPTTIILAFLWIIPESPRWLYTNGKKESAINFLVKYHGEDDRTNAIVELEVAEFEEELNLDGSDKRWWDYRCLYNTRAARYRMMNNLIFVTWGSLSSGGISYFVGAFFATAGITNPTTVLNYNLGNGIQGFLSSFLGSSMCEWLGRRMLLLSALAGISLSWVGIAVSTAMVVQNKDRAAAKAGIAFFYIFNIVYCIGITPLQGIYASEVLSYEQRAKGTAVSRFAVNATGLINQFLTPIALQKIGYKTYIIWAFWNAFEFFISYLFNVETKGFTLEELDEVFEAPNPRKASTRKRHVLVDSAGNFLEDEV